MLGSIFSTEETGMVTREEILVEVQKVPEKYLDELYQIIKDFESSLCRNHPIKT